MASAKDLKKKIKSIANTKKITRTMEMVSAAKAKLSQARVEANTPYSSKLREVLESLSSVQGADHYLLGRPEPVERSVLLVVTANRGLCGGYNTNVLAMAERWLREEEEAGRQVDLTMIGKKGISRCRFRRIPVRESFTHIEDRPTFRQADEIARRFMERFGKGEVERVLAVSTRYHSAGVQRPALTQLLPLEPPGEDGAGGEGSGRRAPAGFLFEPDPQAILDSLLPYSVANALYRLFVEAAASEQIARRVAMKLATDNAEELIRTYTRKYNRQRQAGITQQIAEIVGGAEGLG